MEEHIKNVENLIDLINVVEVYENEGLMISKGKESWEILKRELTINKILEK